MSAARDLFPASGGLDERQPSLTPAEANRLIEKFDAEDAAKGPPTRDDRIAEVNELIARSEYYTKAARSHPDPDVQTAFSDEADRILAKVEKLQDALEREFMK